jgi:hypothetical protein
MYYNQETKTQRHDVLLSMSSLHVPIEDLAGIFLRLELQITEMIGGRDWQFFNNFHKFRTSDCVPPIFPNLAEARDSLVFNWYKCAHDFTFLEKTTIDEDENDIGAWHSKNLTKPDIVQQWKNRHAAILENWSLAFETLVSLRGNTLTDAESSGVEILRVQRDLAMTTLRVTRSYLDNQTMWDKFAPDFARIVARARKVVELTTTIFSDKPVFSLDLGIIGPLYEVASRCRDPYIRRDAIDILKTYSRQEGVWNGFLTARVAERVVKIEEEGLGEVTCASDVPDWARISEVQPTFDQYARMAVVKYSRFRSASDSYRTPVMEVVEW